MTNAMERTLAAVRAFDRDPGGATRRELNECLKGLLMIGGDVKSLGDLTPSDLEAWSEEGRPVVQEVLYDAFTRFCDAFEQSKEATAARYLAGHLRHQAHGKSTLRLKDLIPAPKDNRQEVGKEEVEA